MSKGDTETAKKMTTDTLSTKPPASKLDSDDEVEAGKITDSSFYQPLAARSWGGSGRTSLLLGTFVTFWTSPPKRQISLTSDLTILSGFQKNLDFQKFSDCQKFGGFQKIYI